MPTGDVRLFIDGEEMTFTKRLSDCVEVLLPFEADKTYRLEVSYPVKKRLQRWQEHAKKVLTEAQGSNMHKRASWDILSGVTTEEEFIETVETLPVDMAAKLRIKEVL